MNLFDDPAIAEGYATARPPVHSRVIERVMAALRVTLPLECALDVGCGAGLSTLPLSQFARRCFGTDPAESMLRAARALVPAATFFVAGAEAIPLPSESVDLISAAGSLNYADLSTFFSEAHRVLRPRSFLIVYDFSPGRTFPNDASLAAWFDQFSSRYSWPPFNGNPLNPEILAHADARFAMENHEHFSIGLPMTLAQYLDYMLTETNVAQAVTNGTPRAAIRDWCATTLAPLFSTGPREVIFEGYFACLRSA